MFRLAGVAAAFAILVVLLLLRMPPAAVAPGGGTTALSASPTVSPSVARVTPTATHAATTTPTPAPTATPTSRPTPTPSLTPTPTSAPPPPPGLALRVSGNRLLNAAGQPIRLLGVDRSGTEYACIQGWGIFDGPNDAGSVAAMASWHINAVRVPLNEDCWLNINGVNPGYGGTAYQNAIVSYVNLLHQRNLYVILDLHWNAPGTQRATGQQPMPDADHSPAFWRSVAATFKNDPAIVFDLYNEPYGVDWNCWLSGCTSPGWPTAGMQQLVNAVRGAGANNVIMLGGLSYSNDLTGWLSHEPSDASHQLAASFHTYNFNTCNSVTCWNAQVSPVTAQVPVVTGEIGENDCGHGFIDSFMAWADSHAVSYLGWTWDTWNCSNGPALISSYNGTPTGFGVGFRDHLLIINP